MNRREALKAALALPLVGLVPTVSKQEEPLTHRGRISIVPGRWWGWNVVLTQRELEAMQGAYGHCKFHILDWDAPLRWEPGKFHKCHFIAVTGKNCVRVPKIKFYRTKHGSHSLRLVGINYTDGTRWSRPENAVGWDFTKAG